MTAEEGQGQDSAGPPPVFLERQSYRRRRLTDVAKLLPLTGAALFAIPLLWPQTGEGDATIPMSSAIVYVFGVWAALILLSLLFGFGARRWGGSDERDPERD